MATARWKKKSRTAPSLSVQRCSLPYPFIHERVRSTTQRLPTWTGGRHALAGDLAVEPQLGQQVWGALCGLVPACHLDHVAASAADK